MASVEYAKFSVSNMRWYAIKNYEINRFTRNNGFEMSYGGENMKGGNPGTGQVELLI